MDKHKWTPCTHNRLVALTKKYMPMLHLSDWTIHIDCNGVPRKEIKIYIAERDEPPAYRTSGTTYCLPDQQEAFIWIPIDLAREDDECAQEILWHEMLHVFFAAYPDNEELRTRILAEVIYPRLKENEK